MVCAVLHSRALGPQPSTPHGCPLTLWFPRGANHWFCPQENTQRTAWTGSVGARQTHQPADGEGYFPSTDNRRWGCHHITNPQRCIHLCVVWAEGEPCRWPKSLWQPTRTGSGISQAAHCAPSQLPFPGTEPAPSSNKQLCKESWSSSTREKRRGKQQVATEAAERRTR